VAPEATIIPGVQDQLNARNIVLAGKSGAHFLKRELKKECFMKSCSAGKGW